MRNILSFRGAKLVGWKPAVGDHLYTIRWMLTEKHFDIEGYRNEEWRQRQGTDCVNEGPVSIWAYEAGSAFGIFTYTSPYISCSVCAHLIWVPVVYNQTILLNTSEYFACGLYSVSTQECKNNQHIFYSVDWETTGLREIGFFLKSGLGSAGPDRKWTELDLLSQRRKIWTCSITYFSMTLGKPFRQKHLQICFWKGWL